MRDYVRTPGSTVTVRDSLPVVVKNQETSIREKGAMGAVPFFCTMTVSKLFLLSREQDCLQQNLWLFTCYTFWTVHKGKFGWTTG